jgi:Effector-associated domain 8
MEASGFELIVEVYKLFVVVSRECQILRSIDTEPVRLLAIKIQADRIIIRNLIYEKVFTRSAHTELSRGKTILDASHEVILASGVPKIGTTFLESDDRKRIVDIVGAVIVGRSENGIRILLANCSVAERLINRINYNQGTRNVAEDIVRMLELSGSLNSPEYHALGAFFVELEKEVGYDAKSEISALIAKYNLMR